MALPTWPEGLSYKPSRDGYGVPEPYAPPRQTEFEDGPPLARKTSLQRKSRHSYKIDFLDLAEFNRFRQFVEFDLANGTSSFVMPVFDPATGDYGTRTVRIDKGTYKADATGAGFVVSFTLMIFDW